MTFLKIEGITKNFEGLTALKEVSFEVSQGQIKSIIGPNGAGKTTLFNLISGLHHPDVGRIFFSGKEITENIPERNAELGIARTFQLVKPFYNMTVLENVMIGGLKKGGKVREARRKAFEVLEFLGMDKKKDIYPGKLTIEDRKRLELARALATSPSLLLLDEVMAGLNLTEVEEFNELIRKIRNDGITVLMIEHVMHAVLSLSDEVVVLNYGEKIYDGTSSEVIRDRMVLEAYLGEDFSLT